MEDDKVDIDSGYSNDNELNASCCGSGNSVDITGDHSQHGSHSRARAVAQLAALQAAPASGYTNDHGLNSNCHHPKLTALSPSPQPTHSQRPHFSHQLRHSAPLRQLRQPLLPVLWCMLPPATFGLQRAPLSATQVASAASLTSTQAQAATSNFQPPAPPLGTSTVVSAATLIPAQATVLPSKPTYHFTSNISQVLQI